MSWDAPNRFIGWAYIPTPWKNWAVANLTEYHTGFPFSVNNDAGAIIGGPNSYRYPDFLEINLHVERRFEFHGQRWAIRGGFNNITNHQNPNTVINNIDSDQFLSYYGGQHRAMNFRIRWLGKI